MKKEELLEKYADAIAAESCTEAFFYEGKLYYHYSWLNEVEMMTEEINFCFDGSETEDPRGEKVPLGKYYKAQTKGEQVK